MSSAFRLASVAPRLALARDQHEAWIIEQRRRERYRRNRLLEAERLVAHRELQLQRAFATGRGDYIAERQRKLNRALKIRARWTA